VRICLIGAIAVRCEEAQGSMRIDVQQQREREEIEDGRCSIGTHVCRQPVALLLIVEGAPLAARAGDCYHAVAIVSVTGIGP
jgi:hypothetical protein